MRGFGRIAEGARRHPAEPTHALLIFVVIAAAAATAVIGKVQLECRGVIIAVAASERRFTSLLISFLLPFIIFCLLIVIRFLAFTRGKKMKRILRRCGLKFRFFASVPGTPPNPHR